MPVSPTVPRRRPRNAQATRAALLRAATFAFTERGFDGASVDQIVRAAGVNKAMVSYHFGGKAGLYHAILEADLATLAAGIAATRASTARAPARLAHFIAVFGELHRNSPHLSVLILREILAGGRQLERVAVPRFVLVFQTIEEIAAQGVREKAFREIDPFLFHQSLMGSLLYFFAARPFRERMIAEGKVPVARAPSTDEYIRHIQSFVIRGLALTESAAAEES